MDGFSAIQFVEMELFNNNMNNVMMGTCKCMMDVIIYAKFKLISNALVSQVDASCMSISKLFSYFTPIEIPDKTQAFLPIIYHLNIKHYKG